MNINIYYEYMLNLYRLGQPIEPISWCSKAIHTYTHTDTHTHPYKYAYDICLEEKNYTRKNS